MTARRAANVNSRVVTFEDRMLTCRDCGQEFVWTAGEQEFYHQKGLLHVPRRCPTDRQRVRAERAAKREMHDIVCSNCGKPGQVPFAPRLDKPVYCSDCFDKVRAQA